VGRPTRESTRTERAAGVSMTRGGAKMPEEERPSVEVFFLGRFFLFGFGVDGGRLEELGAGSVSASLSHRRFSVIVVVVAGGGSVGSRGELTDASVE
jgi:hypothetical protein